MLGKWMLRIPVLQIHGKTRHELQLDLWLSILDAVSSSRYPEDYSKKDNLTKESTSKEFLMGAAAAAIQEFISETLDVGAPDLRPSVK